MAQLGWSAKADVDPRPAPIDWGSAAVNLDVADPDSFAVSPALVLPGWTLEQPGAYASSVT